MKTEEGIFFIPFEDFDKQFMEQVKSFDLEEQTKKLEQKTNIDRQVEFKKVKLRGGIIYECPLCCNVFLPSEAIFCTKNHFICSSCCKGHIMADMSQGCPKNNCYSEECGGFYTESVINKVLDKEEKKAFDAASFNLNISKFGAEKMIRCFSCGWGFYNAEGRKYYTYQCENRNCMKRWCLICNGEAHGKDLCPKEVEESEEALARYVSEAMSEASTKRCPNCKQATFKYSGCNHIAHPCGTHWCYYCLKEITPGSTGVHHKHFKESTCPEYENDQTKKADKKKVGEAGYKAVEEWKSKHPRFQVIQNKLDKLIQEFLMDTPVAKK